MKQRHLLAPWLVLVLVGACSMEGPEAAPISGSSGTSVQVGEAPEGDEIAVPESAGSESSGATSQPQYEGVVPALADAINVRGCYSLEDDNTAAAIDCEELHDGQILRTGVNLPDVAPDEANLDVWRYVAGAVCGDDFREFTGTDSSDPNPIQGLAVLLEDGSGANPIVSCAVVNNDGSQWAGSAESITGSYFGIDVGECFDFPTPTANALEVGCSEPHEAEMFVVDAPINIDASEAPFPTDLEWDALAGRLCDEAFTEYTGIDVEDELSDLTYTYLFPIEEEWFDVSVRTMSCAVVRYDGARFAGSTQV